MRERGVAASEPPFARPVLLDGVLEGAGDFARGDFLGAGDFERALS